MIKRLINKLKLKDRTKNTIKSLENPLKQAQEWIGKPLEDASYKDISSYISFVKANGNVSTDKKWKDKKHSLSGSTIHSIQRKLLQFYKFCYDETDNPKYLKLIRQIDNDKVDSPKSDIEAKDISTPAEIKRVINVATLERDRCIVAVLFESGMRISEFMALTLDMVEMIDEGDIKKVIFHIPNEEGCKTGARDVSCVEVYGYVEDWLKCNSSSKFMPLTTDAVRKIIAGLYEKAGINKPCHPHMLRHSAITYAAHIKMTETAMSYRFWGIPHSSMVNRYIHLSQQSQDEGYLAAKGLTKKDNEDKTKNSISSRCVECGRLIQNGSLCKQCEEIKHQEFRIKRLEKALKIIEEIHSGEPELSDEALKALVDAMTD
jgi:site-specific recombinase XerD